MSEYVSVNSHGESNSVSRVFQHNMMRMPLEFKQHPSLTLLPQLDFDSIHDAVQ